MRANDLDPDGGLLQVTVVNTDSAHGTIAIASGGKALTYTSDLDYCNPGGTEPLDTFTYTLNGGDTATVSVRIRC